MIAILKVLEEDLNRRDTDNFNVLVIQSLL
jgi:hypothetical protein